MALVKYNNNSISAVTSAASIPSGALTHIKTLTASSSATLSFVHGTDGVVLDSTYPIYKFEFINIHPATNMADFSFNMSTDGGSNYNVAKTSTYFKAQHQGSTGNYGSLDYFTAGDLAQGTGFQRLTEALSNGNTASMSGTLTIYNPSSSVFVKHFMYEAADFGNDNFIINEFVAGYGNTQSAVNSIQFKFDTGNIDAGTIKLYGIKDS